MKLYTTAFIGLACFFGKVCGSLVEVLVKPGDNVTLHCDCQIVTAQDIQWIKFCSSKIQPPLIISAYKSLLHPIPRLSLSWNVSSNSIDLVIENVTEADLGLYYCTNLEEKRVDINGIMKEKNIYHNSDVLIKLTFKSPESPPVSPVCDCWQLWLCVCAVSTLLSAFLAFVCGYRCCRKTGPEPSEDPQSSSEMDRQLHQEQNMDTEIYYASLNIPKKGNKHPQLKKQKISRQQSSDFSVYNSVRLYTKVKDEEHLQSADHS